MFTYIPPLVTKENEGTHAECALQGCPNHVPFKEVKPFFWVQPIDEKSAQLVVAGFCSFSCALNGMNPSYMWRA